MTPKKVWGVIIIILGILFFFGGANKYYEVEFYGKEIQSMQKYLPNNGDSAQYQKMIESEKNNGAVGSLLGIAMAVGGTLLLRGNKE